MVTVIKKNKSQSEILDGVREYAKLRQKLDAQGIFDRSYGYYTMLAICLFIGFFVSGYFIIRLSSIPFLILFGILFSFFSVQIAGLLHDAGHRTIFKSTVMNDVVGYVCGSLLAMGYSGWKLKHNMHHSHPNQEEEDPDLDLPLLSFTKSRLKRKKGFAALIKKYQAYLYYPMGSFVGFSVRIESIKNLLKNYTSKKIWEFIILGIGIFIWFILPFFVFSLPKSTLLFFVVNFTIGFYLLNVFAPNHKGMTQFAKNVKISFMEQQIMTSRNIYGNWLTDFLYMGLNYQIEHHLFPNTPRNKLKKITPFVLAICRKRNLEFTQTTILQSNKMILSELHQIALTA
jgi:fatty acid desaturase